MKKLKTPTVRGLRQWATRQPRTKKWDYYDSDHCPLAGYLRSLGYTKVVVGGKRWECAETGWNVIPYAVRLALYRAIKLDTNITQPALVRACS